MAEDQRPEPIAKLKVHFEENIIWQVHNMDPLQPELPPIDNPEAEYLPYIIDKIRNKQLVTHIQKFASDFASVCKIKWNNQDPQEEFLQMFRKMMQDNKNYTITFDPDAEEEKEEANDKRPDDPPPYPGSPVLKIFLQTWMTQNLPMENKTPTTINLTNQSIYLTTEPNYENIWTKNANESMTIKTTKMMPKTIKKSIDVILPEVQHQAQVEVEVDKRKDQEVRQTQKDKSTRNTSQTIIAYTAHQQFDTINIDARNRNISHDQDPGEIRLHPDHIRPI